MPAKNRKKYLKKIERFKARINRDSSKARRMMILLEVRTNFNQTKKKKNKRNNKYSKESLEKKNLALVSIVWEDIPESKNIYYLAMKNGLSGELKFEKWRLTWVPMNSKNKWKSYKTIMLDRNLHLRNKKLILKTYKISTSMYRSSLNMKNGILKIMFYLMILSFQTRSSE